MAYINIPSLNYNNLQFDIIKKDMTKEEEIFISNSLNHYLSNIKQQIDKYYEYWDYYKKLTNPYEFIHTQVPEIKISVCKYKPLSRSFFKMIEIINTFSFLCEKGTINSFHLAEGPGGFIEAFNYKRNNKGDKYYGMTLISEDINIPSWKKSSQFINNNKNVIIEYGDTKTGDLFMKENLIYCFKNYANSMNYITGDGGFDFSVDFNKQEELSIKLIIAQIFFAIIMQKKGGNFVLKIFDIFKFKTLEILFFLSNLYEYVYIYKPYTSRIANSEKYIICKNFKNNNKNICNEIIDNFDYVLENIDNIHSLFNIKLPKLFIKKIEEINAIYGQQQIENINTTLNFIREYINIKYNNYQFSESDSEDLVYEKEYDVFIEKNIIDSCNIVLSIPLENSIDTELVNDLFKLNPNSNSFISPIISSETNFKYIKEDKFFLSKSNLSPSNLSINSDNEDKYSFGEEDEFLFNTNNCSKLLQSNNFDKLNTKINFLKNINIQKSINWCNKYNFPINKYFLTN